MIKTDNQRDYKVVGENKMKHIAVVLILAAATAVFNTSDCRANIVTLGFDCITNNDPGDAAIGEAQLFVDVSDVYADQVLFTFRNTGPKQSSITEVYFDDGSLLGIASVINNPPGVVFVEGAHPPELPGAMLLDPPFETTTGFLAESVPPQPKKGVNPGEQLSILFNLQNTQTYQNVINEIHTGELRIGVHVTDFKCGGSESFVAVPEPATITLLGLSAVFGLIRRKRIAS
jgi:hypothetical protein